MLDYLGRLVADPGSSGVLRLPGSGEVYLKQGRIVHAWAGSTLGEEALFFLALWGSDRPSFEAGVTTSQETVKRPASAVLAEAERRVQEWQVLQKKVPSLEVVPEFVSEQRHDAQILLNQTKWLVLSKVDGQRNVQQVAEACGMPVFDAAKIVYGLIVAGLLRPDVPARTGG